MRRRVGWLAGLVALSVSCALAEPPPKVYRIAGVVVSTRDGGPVPYCRLTATAVPPAQIGSAGSVQVGSAQLPPGMRPRLSGPPNVVPGGGAGRGFGGAQRGMGPGGRGGAAADKPNETTADASGHFSLELPRAGAWNLAATARGFRGQTYDEHDGYFSAVVLTEAAPAFALTFRLAPDSILTGLIFDEAGEPVASAQVVAELIPAPMPGVPAGAQATRAQPTGFAQTDDRGRYEMDALAPGVYRMVVRAQLWYASGPSGVFRPQMMTLEAARPIDPPLDPSLDFVYAVTWFPGTDDERAAEPISLAAGEERQVDFHLTAIPAMHLRVPRPPQPALPQPDGGLRPLTFQRPPTVTRVGTEMQAQMMPSVVNGSEWEFGGLTPGTYEVTTPGPTPQSAPEVRQIEVRIGSRATLSMEGAKPLIPITIQIEGLPDPEVSVELVDTETGRRFNAQGRGRRGMPQMPPGEGSSDDAPVRTRTVLVPAHEYEVYVADGSGDYMTGVSATGATVVGRTVKVDGPASLMLHVANVRGQVEGVAKIDGKAAQGAMVLLVPATLGSAGNLTQVVRDETNTDGTFLLEGVVPGRYILVAIDHGWEVDWRRPETLAQYLAHGVPVEVRGTAKLHEEIEAVSR